MRPAPGNTSSIPGLTKDVSPTSKSDSAHPLDLPRHEPFRKLEFAVHEPLPRTPDAFRLPPSQQSLSQGNTCKALQGVPEIVVLGTSTGGPQALQDILPQLPANLPVAMLVVQHMPPGFTAPFAERLDHLSKVKVKEAQQGEVLQPREINATFVRQDHITKQQVDRLHPAEENFLATAALSADSTW